MTASASPDRLDRRFALVAGDGIMGELPTLLVGLVAFHLILTLGPAAIL